MSFSAFLEDFWNDKASQIQLGAPGKITKFDKEKMRADVQPLFNIKNNLDEETPLPILADVPVLFTYSNGFFIRPEYANNDYVWIGFSTHDIEFALGGETRTASGSLFSAENAVVLGSYSINSFSESLFTKDGLILGKGQISIRISQDEILLNEGTDYAVKYEELKKAFDELKSDFNNFVNITYNLHNHPTAAPGAPSTPSVTGTQSSADMQQAKVEKVRL